MNSKLRPGRPLTASSETPWRGPLSRRTLLELFGTGAVAAWASACSGQTSPPPPAFPVWSGGDLHYRSLIEVAGLIQARQLSPVELTEIMLERISTVDARLKSYATVMRESALAAARRAEKEILEGNYRGTLHGIPVAVKDLCFTRGVRTMGGMGVLRDFVPEYDSTVVRRLSDAGAVLLGKLNLTEGAMAGYHPDFDIPVNPWGEDLWVGASSSGSGVATAAGLCFASLGSDTGGSIRFPAMANGIVGLKPTYGRVSRYGVLPLAESMDHVGPMTRFVADAAAVLQVIAGQDPMDPTSLSETVPDLLGGIGQGVRGLRIGYDQNYAGQGVEPRLVQTLEQAVETLAGLGAQIVEIEIPPFAGELQTAWFSICAFEAHAAHRETYPSRAREYGPYLREILEMGAQVSAEAYQGAGLLRAEYSRRFEEALARVDALVSPGGGVPFAFPPELQYQGTAQLDPAVVEKVYTQFTFPADFSGVPTLSLPCGISDLEVPFTMQLTGSRLSEALLCRIGQAYEEATPWHQRRPVEKQEG